MVRITLLAGIFSFLFFGCNTAEQGQASRPNILFCIADDASFPHMSAYGCDFIQTPSFDRIAEQGILFTRCYTPNAKCSPSRSCILTGRNSWQLEAACNHVPLFPEKFASFVEVLDANGYFTGFTGKGWAPGDPGTVDGRRRQLTGTPYQSMTLDSPKGISETDYAGNFSKFLEDAPENSPWFFWYGGREPHRPYQYGIGKQLAGKDPSDAGEIPDYWPDTEVIRNDLLDYAFEIEYYDSHIDEMLTRLEESGQLDNTLIVVTSDNGMPFPRIKGQEYEMSNHMPLAIMWKEGISQPGRTVSDFVSFIDFAPTFLELAGLKWEETAMSPTPGRSLASILSGRGREGETHREFVVFGKERHDVGRPQDRGYPIRGIVQDEYLYVMNFETGRWPAGNPETGYLNCDGSPTKTVILDLRRQGENVKFWKQNFGRRPEEELYHVKSDPFCENNLAADSAYTDMKAELKGTLFRVLEEEGDLRMSGNGEIYESYPYQDKTAGFYERYMSGEKVEAPWVEKSDFEKGPITEQAED